MNSIVVEGMQFDRGYLSPYFINNSGQYERAQHLENPYHFVTRQKDFKHT